MSKVPAGAVLFDAGGVLTPPMRTVMGDACAAAGLEVAVVAEVLAPVSGSSVTSSVFHKSERGELGLQDLMAWLDEQVVGLGALADPASRHFMFGGLALDERMLSLARELSHAGVAVGILSNQFLGWEDWFNRLAAATGVFDAVVLSCEIGERKPDAAAYHVACRALGVDPAAALMIDDSPAMVAGAVAAGLTGIQFVDPEQAAAAVREVRRV